MVVDNVMKANKLPLPLFDKQYGFKIQVVFQKGKKNTI